MTQKRLKASPQGKQRIKAAREAKGWIVSPVENDECLKKASEYLDPSWSKNSNDYAKGINEVSWLNFLYARRPIATKIFEAYCQALEIEVNNVIDNTITEDNSLLSWSQYNENWVGRLNIIETLKNKLENSHRIIVIVGITGIGKTALAERMVSDLFKDYG